MLDTLLARHWSIQIGRIAAALFLMLLLIALGAAILRRCRITFADPMERLLLQAATGFAVYQCIVRWLGELPIVSPIGIAAIVLSLAAIGATEWRSLRDDLHLAFGHGVPIAFVLLVLAPLVMALAPAVSKDALIYHLRFPEMTLREGSWAHDPANSASLYPAAAGTLYLPALAVDRSGVVAQLVHWCFFLLGISTIAAIARRLGARTGRTAAVLFASLPLAAVVAGWAWADLPLVFALAASALAMLAGTPALAIVLLGLAASIKYSAFLAGLPLLLAAVVMLVRARAFGAMAIGAVLGAVVASPWWITNWGLTGNPIHPLGASEHPAVAMIANWSGETQTSWLGIWSDYFLRPQTLDEDAGGLLFPAIALLGLGLGFARPRLRVASSIVLAMTLLHLPLTTAMRLLLPVVAAVLVLAGAAIEQLERRRWLAQLLVAAFVIRGAIVTAAHNAHFLNPLPAAAGLESEAQYLLRNFPSSALYERADAKLPRDARVLAVNEVRLFHFPRPVTVSRVYDPPLLRRYVGGNAATPALAIHRMRADGITHLLIGTHPVERAHGAIVISAQEQQVMRGVVRASRLLDREKDVLLFELPSPVAEVVPDRAR